MIRREFTKLKYFFLLSLLIPVLFFAQRDISSWKEIINRKREVFEEKKIYEKELEKIDEIREDERNSEEDLIQIKNEKETAKQEKPYRNDFNKITKSFCCNI